MEPESPKIESDNNCFAEDLAQRLNRLIRDADTDTYAAVRDLLEMRMQVNDTVADHPDLIVTMDNQLGILGLLNAAVRQGLEDKDHSAARLAIQVSEESFRFIIIPDPSLED